MQVMMRLLNAGTRACIFERVPDDVHVWLYFCAQVRARAIISEQRRLQGCIGSWLE